MTRHRTLMIALVLFGTTWTLLAQRTPLRPGRNLFSVEQDIEMGRQVASDAERQLKLISHPDANAYLTALGNQLSEKAPGPKFPFTFKLVDDRSINAFALPGGPIYIHRGVIEAAANEAQLAGVIGHEIGHIMLRHGTTQVTRAQLAQAPLAVLGGVLGDRAWGQVLSQVGGFAANSVLLRYSRDAETQSDMMGTHLLYDLGYDPRAMAQFFEILARDHKGSRTEQFFSNHPIPQNRATRVNTEIRNSGGVPANIRTDSPDFQDVKRILLAMPEPATIRPTDTASPGAAGPPPAPSSRLVDFQSADVTLRHPENWKPAGNGSNVVIAPPGGVVQAGIAYGFIIDVFQPQNARTLEEGTIQLLQSLQKSDPNMKLQRSRIPVTVAGQRGLQAELTNVSPLGGEESNVVTTVLRPDTRVQYFIQVAPARDLQAYQPVLRAILASVRLR